MVESSPSAWVRRFAGLIRPGGRVLDLAAGAGRHTQLLLDMGLRVTAVDRDIPGWRPLACEQGEVSLPRPAVIQRIAAVSGPVGRLPEAVDLNHRVVSA